MQNQLINANDFSLANDPTKHLTAPQAKPEVQFIDFSALTTALDVLKASADKLALTMNNIPAPNTDYKNLNEALYRAEQQLLSANGLPRRPWYKHTIYAPGFYTGYGVKTLPGIREAIEQRNWPEARQQIAVDAQAINGLAKYLDKVGM
jgi:N-acetylated-alpha-linked acidic dipeptidase